jgi:hypothetical protein
MNARYIVHAIILVIGKMCNASQNLIQVRLIIVIPKSERDLSAVLTEKVDFSEAVITPLSTIFY